MAVDTIEPTTTESETELLGTLQTRRDSLIAARAELAEQRDKIEWEIRTEREDYIALLAGGEKPVPIDQAKPDQYVAMGDELLILKEAGSLVERAVRDEGARIQANISKREAAEIIRRRGGEPISIELVRAAVTNNVANFKCVVEHVEALDFRATHDCIELVKHDELLALADNMERRANEGDNAAALRKLAGAVRKFAESNKQCRDLASAMYANDQAKRVGTHATKQAARGGLALHYVAPIWACGNAYFERGTLGSHLDAYRNRIRKGPLGRTVQLLD